MKLKWKFFPLDNLFRGPQTSQRGSRRPGTRTAVEADGERRVRTGGRQKREKKAHQQMAGVCVHNYGAKLKPKAAVQGRNRLLQPSYHVAESQS